MCLFSCSKNRALLTSCELATAPGGCVLVSYTHHRPHLAQRDMAFFDMARECGWKCEKRLTERFPVRFLGCSEVSSLCATSMFRHRHCLAHASGGPGQGGGALGRARVESHMIVRRWRCIFGFNRMKNNRAWRCGLTTILRENEPFFSVCLTLEKNLIFCSDCYCALAWTFQLASKRLPLCDDAMSSCPDHFPDGPEQRARDDAIREAMASELERQCWTGTRTSGPTRDRCKDGPRCGLGIEHL